MTNKEQVRTSQSFVLKRTISPNREKLVQTDHRDSPLMNSLINEGWSFACSVSKILYSNPFVLINETWCESYFLGFMWPLGAWYFLYLIVVSTQNEKSENKIFYTFMLFFISVDQFNCECRNLQQFQECKKQADLHRF